MSDTRSHAKSRSSFPRSSGGILTRLSSGESWQNHFRLNRSCSATSIGSSLASSWLSFQLIPFTKPLSPYSTLRVLWDAVGVLLVMFDIILIPLSVAWDGHDGDFEKSIFKVGVIFWSLDVLMSLNTGFDSAGSVVVSRWAILKR